MRRSGLTREGGGAPAGRQVVKKLWEYIKAHDLQNPKDKRKIVLDDALGRLFKPPLNMFSMNKQLSRHVYVEGAGPARPVTLPLHLSPINTRSGVC